MWVEVAETASATGYCKGGQTWRKYLLKTHQSKSIFLEINRIPKFTNRKGEQQGREEPNLKWTERPRCLPRDSMQTADAPYHLHGNTSQEC